MISARQEAKFGLTARAHSRSLPMSLFVCDQFRAGSVVYLSQRLSLSPPRLAHAPLQLRQPLQRKLQ